MIGNSIQKAAEILRQDDLVSIPTETVYGLAGNALSEQAVVKIFQVKNRPTFDPLIVHVLQLEQLKQLVKVIPEKALLLAQHFSPGPITFLLPKKPLIPDLVTAGSPLVAVRIPQHPLSLSLLAKINFPLAAPSANPFGYISPTTAQHVEQQLGSKISYILDGGPCEVGLESTIIGFEKEKPKIYRKGGIAQEEIEAVVGPVESVHVSTSNPKTPGTLKRHYAPSIPLSVGNITTMLNDCDPTQVGILSFKDRYEKVPEANQVVLSPNDDLREAAQNLFAGMRYLDQLPIQQVLAEWLPEEGLGKAINDRLRRAAAK